MKYTVYDRLLKREVGHQRRTYTDIRGIYGDKHWVDNLDIVNELEGHNGCVNALRYVAICLEFLALGTDDLLLAGRDLAAFSPQAQTTTASTSTRITPAQTQSSSA